jgi:hypothetical protein
LEARQSLLDFRQVDHILEYSAAVVLRPSLSLDHT